ncbi:predicted protein [Uncinocarpus reesii 1704]|uniref:Aminoglycoside phosphotransferase domain-containing protein n=1 Tax=Uncinocarpus reesii (strain UAMH 1704) TaxID=336963 RepID=C4JL78_UNCRE|nr:uncharacterized protein UREG_03586 [Uncinocarpus reesii 1704]EEP78740.1 predicted protein [Uncinocarpus reesii 1704]
MDGPNSPVTASCISQGENARRDSNNETYSSTIDYVYTILKLIFNDFHLGKDSVFNEEDAKNYLYGIFASQGIVMEWVKHKDNHGPFVLMHGDLQPPNIFVDDDLNIVSVIDWEWSHTIPLQMFLPPSWITGQELPAATRRPSTFAFKYYGEDKDRRVEKFFNLDLRKPQVEALQKIMLELEAFKKELALVGLEPIEPDPIPAPEPGKQSENAKFMSKMRGLADIRQLCRRFDIAIGSLPCWIPWSLAGISLSACCIMAKQRQ